MSSDYLRLYAYHPLDPNKRGIRTLRLLPGEGGEQISIELESADLEDPTTSFMALSYVWGTQIALERVKVEAEEFEVTANLLVCLRHLRDPQNSVMLWIDALCINQHDIAEKSDQVAMMGYIYSRCTTVCCWLGAPLDSKPLRRNPFQLIYHFAGDKHYHDLPGFFLTDSGDISFEENADFAAVWEGFLHVAQSTWWTRAWTAQEVVVPSDAILRYGKWTTKFDDTIIARRFRNAHLSNCCAEALRALPDTNKMVFDWFLTQIEWIERFRTAGLPQGRPLSSKDLPRIFPDYRYRPFYELVLTFSSRLCKDPRDQIFSLLAMAESPLLKDYRPDYGRTVTDTYTQAFTLMLKDTFNDLRCMIGPMFNSTYHNCPSWVPDFSRSVSPREVETVLRRVLLSSLFNAANGEIGDAELVRGKELFLEGIRADTVAGVSCVLGSVFDGPDCLKKVLQKWTEFCRETLATSNASSVRMRLARTLCASLVDDGVPLYGPHRGWRRISQDDLPSEAEWEQFLNGNMWALHEGYRERWRMRPRIVAYFQLRAERLVSVTTRSNLVTRFGL